MTTWVDIVRQVEARAEGRCEYCRMHTSLQGATFHIEHILPTSRGGLSEASNLAMACPSCNLRKSDRLMALDPQSGVSVSLFHPRSERWDDHFEMAEYRILGRTPVGRATVLALDLNHPRRMLIRHAEELFGLFPP